MHALISAHAAFQDYIPVSFMLELDESRTNVTVHIPIVNDTIAEQNEIFLVGLQLLRQEEDEGAPQVILEPQYAGVLIVDDDGGLWSGSVCMCARMCHVLLICDKA